MQSQPLSFLDFTDTQEKCIELKKMDNPTVLVTNDNQIKILNVLNQVFPRGLKSSQISEIAEIHRSTTHSNTKELEELGLLVKNVLTGTQTHKNPTLIFSISPEYKQIIDEFLELRIKLTPELRIELSQDLEVFDTSFATIKDTSFEIIENESNEIPVTFEEEVENVFIQVFEYIKELEERIFLMQQEINDLKVKSNEKPSTEPYLPKARSLAKSLSSRVKRG